MKNILKVYPDNFLAKVAMGDLREIFRQNCISYAIREEDMVLIIGGNVHITFVSKDCDMNRFRGQKFDKVWVDEYGSWK